MILITTCRKPCKNTRKFAKMFALLIPNSVYEVRGKKNIYSLIDIARNKGLRRLAIITDLKGNPGKIEFLKITKKEWNFDKTMNIKALSGEGITAEEIKVEIGSAVPTNKNETMEIRGRDMIAGLPKTITINSNEITEAMRDELDKIILAIRVVLERTPPELGSDVIDRGMVMTGGGSLLRNIDKLLTKSLGIPCYVAEDALLCVARGTGIALENLDDYKRSFLFK